MNRYLIYFCSLVAGVLLLAISAEATKPSYTCANVRCGSGSVCIETPSGPTCEANYSGPSCASTLCQVGNQCVETSTGPQCVPNSSPPGYHNPPSSYPSYPGYQPQSCAYGGYYHYGQLICNPAPAWRNPYQYGWGYYNAPPVYRPPVYTPPTYRRRAPWDPNGPEIVLPPQEPRVCTMEYDPVCAEKPVVCVRSPCPPARQTFSNACHARADNYTILYKGQCR